MAWTLWYRDLFDREAPPHEDDAGVALLDGLLALWRATIGEGLTPDGQRSFSDFSLSWGSGTVAQLAWIDTFRTAELVKLRRWAAAEPLLLASVARVHERLIVEHRATVASLSGGEEATAILDVIAATAVAAELPRALGRVRVVRGAGC